MYLQLVDYCNFTCDHCGFNCTAEGTAMSKEVLLKALEVAKAFNDYKITIGGGEPTLHPQFKEFLWEIILANSAIEWDNRELLKVYIVTNGSVEEHALMLAQLDHSGVICARLSQDWYHDGFVSPQIVAAFGRNRIVDVSGKVIKAGRAIETFSWDEGHEDACLCDTRIVKPNGDIMFCGCLDAPKIGTVFDILDRDERRFCGYDDFNLDSCWREVAKDRELEAAVNCSPVGGACSE